MNTTLSTAPGRQDHPPQQSSLERVPYQARRVNLLDRVALHVGIALIKWGRRPLAVPSREQRAKRVEQQLARLEREREYERALRPFLPVR
jgi:hypothetical protein